MKTFLIALPVLAASLTTSAQGERLFKNWDKNGDGFLEKSEIPRGPRKIFDQKDVNGDGKISMKEHLGKARKPTAKPEQRKREAVSNDGATFTINQKWSQHPDGYERPVWAIEPKSKAGKAPVLIYFHGNGGNAGRMINNWARDFPDHLVVAPQGYLRSWNIRGEQSKAPDIQFFRELIATIAEKYPNADMKNVSLIGTSNGGGYIHRIMIEVDEPLFKNAVPMVSSFIAAEFHDDSFWFPLNGNTENYDTKKKPVPAGRRILYVHGTDDKVVPFHGGMRGRASLHLSAYETAYRWAGVHGYKGPKLTEKDGKEAAPSLLKIHYPDTPMTLIQVLGGSHGLAPHREAAIDLVKAFIGAKK